MGNKNLQVAKNDKKDEFYTQLSDIEKELKYYKEHFKGKIVFCNCDDPYESNFFKYFAMNFNELGLKKLMCTCYVQSPIIFTQLDLFGNEHEVGTEKKGRHDKAYKIIINEIPDYNKDGALDLSDIQTLMKSDKNVMTELEEDGDFRSEECIELLKQADVVVTNPPFSLFREYIDTLIEYEKDFLILGNQNAVSYKNIFKYIKDSKLWLGNNAGAMEFIVPEDYEKNNIYINEDGKKMAKFGNICWYTNLDCSKRHEELLLYKEYNPEEYPKYDNYNAINVDKTINIPCDYDEVMGVPITFLDKYNPNQFEIIAFDYEIKDNEDYAYLIRDGWNGKLDRGYIDGKRKYARILIKRKK